MRRAEVGQGRRRTVRHADLVRVQRERDHRVVADERGQLDDTGSAVGVEDALVGRVGCAVVVQEFDRVVVDRLLVRCGEVVAAGAQCLDGLLGKAGLSRLAFVREPLELAVLVSKAFSGYVCRNINELCGVCRFLQNRREFLQCMSPSRCRPEETISGAIVGNWVA